MKLTGIKLKLWNWMMDSFTKIRWLRTQAAINGGVYYQLVEADHDKIREILQKDYLIILTRRKSHFTSYMVVLASLFVNGKASHYTHALMNVEGDLAGHLGYKLIQATGVGVCYSSFMEVFDCDSVALLSPKGIPLEEWTLVLDKVKEQLGKGYDTLFDLTQDQQVSCVEMIYWGLKKLPDFEQHFPKLIALIQSSGNNLTPQMLYDTGELEIVYEIRY
jgi:hypothetical protein